MIPELEKSTGSTANERAALECFCIVTYDRR